MSYGEWRPYVSVARRRARAVREMKKLRSRGMDVEPIDIQGRKIAHTFWGRSLVQAPGTIQRLRQPPATRPNLCP